MDDPFHGPDAADHFSASQPSPNDPPTCSEECGGNGWIQCWDCGGAGGYHDCGDDCCPCLSPEPNVVCTTCSGAGIWQCPACGAGWGGERG